MGVLDSRQSVNFDGPQLIFLPKISEECFRVLPISVHPNLLNVEEYILTTRTSYNSYSTDNARLTNRTPRQSQRIHKTCIGKTVIASELYFTIAEALIGVFGIRDNWQNNFRDKG